MGRFRAPVLGSLIVGVVPAAAADVGPSSPSPRRSTRCNLLTSEQITEIFTDAPLDPGPTTVKLPQERQPELHALPAGTTCRPVGPLPQLIAHTSLARHHKAQASVLTTARPEASANVRSRGKRPPRSRVEGRHRDHARWVVRDGRRAQGRRLLHRDRGLRGRPADRADHRPRDPHAGARSVQARVAAVRASPPRRRPPPTRGSRRARACTRRRRRTSGSATGASARRRPSTPARSTSQSRVYGPSSRWVNRWRGSSLASGAPREREIGGHRQPALAARGRPATRRRPSVQSVPSVPATRVIPPYGPHARRRLLEHALDTPTREREADRERVLGDARARRHDVERRAHRRELAEPRAHLVDDVRARRAEPAAAGAASNHQRGHLGLRDRRRAARTARAWRSAARRSRRRRSRDRRRRARCAQRNSWPTRCVTPARSAASSMRRASAASSANGFSQSTCLPASTAAIATRRVRVRRCRDRDRGDARAARARRRDR